MHDALKRTLVSDPRYAARLEELKQKPQVFVALTNHCNFRCEYCSTRGQERAARVDMDEALFRGIAEQCAQAGITPWFGQTYEPFAHPKIARFIDIVTDLGLRFASNTNGSLLTDKLRDRPMNLLVSLSENADDYAYRGSAAPFSSYFRRVVEFTRHRVDKAVPGVLIFQFADYAILKAPDLTYSKRIVSGPELAGRMRRFAAALGLPLAQDDAELLRLAEARGRVVAHDAGGTAVHFLSTKIAPNTSEAFAPSLEAMAEAEGGYCDSCWLMASIQADGGLAYCCCDPTAKAVATRLKPGDKLLEVWLGPKLEAVRQAFRAGEPLSRFCRKCLHPVSEHIKPNLTVREPGLVAQILRDNGVVDDQPWFGFPR